MVLVACSAQNLDRVVTVFRAARRTGRSLVIDAYSAEILLAANRASIPAPTAAWPDVKVFVPHKQRRMLASGGRGALVNKYRHARIWPENLHLQSPKLVSIVGPWMLEELAQLGSLKGAGVIWSQWEGYLKNGPASSFKTPCGDLGLSFRQIHTSGHASIPDLKRLVVAMSPKRLVPIHTFFPDQFPSLFNNVVPVKDGHWLEV